MSKDKILLISILLIAAFLRFSGLDSHALWIDEETTVMETKGIYNKSNLDFILSDECSYRDVINANINSDSGNGILHVSLLHLVFEIVPVSDFNLRIVSVIFGIFLVYFIFSFAKILFNNTKWALLCAALAALHPALIIYSQEGRPYMMAVLFSFLSTVFYYKIAFKGETTIKNLLAYGVFAAIAFLSHYMMLYIFVVHGVFALFLKLNRKQFLYLIGAGAIVAISFLLWYVSGGDEGFKFMTSVNEAYKIKSDENPQDSFYGHTTALSIVQGWVQIILYITGNLLQNTGIQLRVLFPFLVLPFFVFGFVFFNQKDKRKEILFFLVLFFMGPAFSMALAIKAGHNISFQPNYSLFSVPYFIILLGYFVVSIKDSARKYLYAIPLLLIIALAVYSIFIDYAHPGQQKENGYQILVDDIRKKCEEDKSVEALTFKSDKDAIMFNIYLGNSTCIRHQKIDKHLTERYLIEYSDKTREMILK